MSGENQQEKGSLERRQDRAEKEIQDLTSSISHQGQNIASLTTSVESLIKQMSSLFHKTDRPTPWASILTGVGVLIMIGGLAFAPIMTNLSDLKAQVRVFEEHRVESAYHRGISNANDKWAEKMEARYWKEITE